MIEEHSPSRQPSASIVVVSYNTAAYIGSCLLSLMQLRYPELEIIVVDNGSTDGSADMVRSHFPDVEVVELSNNKGFAGGASVGLFMASGDIVATVNPDVRLDSGWLSAVADTLVGRADVGVVGSKILYPDGHTIQHAGGVVHYPLATTEHVGRGEVDRGRYDQAKEVDFVTGAALAMWREVGRSLNFFDEEYFPMYYEDVDLCWRARKEGLRVVYQPKALAYHEESVTMDRQSGQYYGYYHANRLRFVVKRYSPQQVMLDFLPAEAARVSGDMPVEDRKASLALLDNGALDGLEATPSQRKLDTMQAHIAEVLGGWHVYKRSLAPSARAGDGPVAGLRERLKNLSKRWYVWPILQRQIEYNASVARTTREISWQMAELQARVGLEGLLTAGLVTQLNTASVEDMSAEIEALRSRIEQLEIEITRARDPHGVM